MNLALYNVSGVGVKVVTNENKECRASEHFTFVAYKDAETFLESIENGKWGLPHIYDRSKLFSASSDLWKGREYQEEWGTS